MDVGHRHLGSDDIAALLAVFSQYDLTVWAVLTSNTWTRDAARELGLATRIAGTSTDLEGNDLPGIVVDDADASPERSFARTECHAGAGDAAVGPFCLL